jgi:hypothetical protein
LRAVDRANGRQQTGESLYLTPTGAAILFQQAFGAITTLWGRVGKTGKGSVFFLNNKRFLKKVLEPVFNTPPRFTGTHVLRTRLQ